jgi:Ca2+/Na+ antiporter
METLISTQIMALLAEFHTHQTRLNTPESIILAVLFLVGIVLLMMEFKFHRD